MAGLILHEGCCGYTAAGEYSQKGVAVSYSLARSSARWVLFADSLSRINVRHATILCKHCALPRGESSLENILWTRREFLEYKRRAVFAFPSSGRQVYLLQTFDRVGSSFLQEVPSFICALDQFDMQM